MRQEKLKTIKEKKTFNRKRKLNIKNKRIKKTKRGENGESSKKYLIRSRRVLVANSITIGLFSPT